MTLNMTVKLVGGHRASEGNVVVNGYPVCQEGWDGRDASVLCRMLGYQYGFPIIWSKFRETKVSETNVFNMYMKDVDCNGKEPSLFYCNTGFTEICRVQAGVKCLDYDY